MAGKHIHHPAAKRAIAETYRQVSVEHLERLNRAHADGKDPAMTIYLAGLAVECLLRAYRCLIDPEFDAKHDLLKLAQQAQFAAKIPPGDVAAEYSVRLARLAQVWSSNDRFITGSSLTRRVRALGYRRPSNTLQEVAGIIYEDAQWLAAIGRRNWS